MKKILIIVDCQNDFINGPLGFVGANAVVESIAEKAQQYRQNRDEIVFTADSHGDEYRLMREGRRLPLIHCIESSEGWLIHPRLSEFAAASKIFKKQTFGSLELAEYLKSGQYDSVELAGFTTDICVISNAVMVLSALPYADVSVDKKCVGSADKSAHNAALTVMRSMHVDVKE